MTRNTAPKLLLIDDEPALADYLADAATMTGFLPVVAKDDRDFKALLISEQPAVVAIDLGMPGMDGVELLRFLAAQAYAAPVLIISGFDRRVLDSAFRLGEALGLTMVGPLEKPTRLEDIERILVPLRPQPVS